MNTEKTAKIYDLSDSEKVDLIENQEQRIKELKENRRKDCLAFFYWWYNQPGNSTEQGYDEWIKQELK